MDGLVCFVVTGSHIIIVEQLEDVVAPSWYNC